MANLLSLLDASLWAAPRGSTKPWFCKFTDTGLARPLRHRGLISFCLLEEMEPRCLNGREGLSTGYPYYQGSSLRSQTCPVSFSGEKFKTQTSDLCEERRVGEGPLEPC